MTLKSTSIRARLSVYLYALWTLFRHPQTPRLAKWVAIAVIAYALSPIDLIPDFIPVLGLLDDIVIVPLGIALAVKLTPRPLWDEVFRQAQASATRLPRMWAGAVFVALVWLAVMGGAAWLVWRHL
ncbi:YkvA family protein [Piscinibacter terrae]|uniref:DUF1232 domain-containing protein n=1 Tax=Piscinibacter terrae TaxID=2496871 RepID=A0A3N7JZW5_9BURK|nr:YkvA family protein [Albitalea terrae]RQP26299.1 DUF1232 domain-containing protein [Albitalea terrae]